MFVASRAWFIQQRVVWAQVQSATRRASNEVRKERKRKLTGQDGEPTPDAAPDAAGSSRSEAPKAPRIKRVRTAEQKERGAGKQRLVRTVALGNLTAACSASALALARSLGQVPTLARRPAAPLYAATEGMFKTCFQGARLAYLLS